LATYTTLLGATATPPKRERTTSQNSVGSRIVEQNLDHVAVGNLTVGPIRIRKQERGVEVAITPESAAVDWPHTGSPHRRRSVPLLLPIGFRGVEPIDLGRRA
jgi:hypothetical protein